MGIELVINQRAVRHPFKARNRQKLKSRRQKGSSQVGRLGEEQCGSFPELEGGTGGQLLSCRLAFHRVATLLTPSLDTWIGA